MKNRTRKILSRIGAAFLLGMSMFNFGAIWTRQQNQQVPKRAKNVREKSTESVDQSVEDIATIAEKHGNAVILLEQSNQEKQVAGVESQQQSEEDTTVFQRILRYSVIAVWTVSLGIILSSVLLNFPISFGKGALSAVPVFSEKAVVLLEPWSPFFQSNEEIKVDIYLDSGANKIEAIKLAIEFDPQLLEFEGLAEGEFFEKIEIESIDDATGIIYLIFENGEDDINFSSGQKIARLKFSSLGEPGSRNVSITKEDSSVAIATFQEDKMQIINSLDRVDDAQFSVFSESGGEVRCGKLTGEFPQEEITAENWRDVFLETNLPKDALVWVDMEKDNSFVCATDSQNKIHFLLRKKGELKKAVLFLKNEKKNYTQKGNWREDGYEFFSISFDLEGETNVEDSISEVMLRVNGSLNWPKKGLAKIWLK